MAFLPFFYSLANFVLLLKQQNCAYALLFSHPSAAQLTPVRET